MSHNHLKLWKIKLCWKMKNKVDPLIFKTIELVLCWVCNDKHPNLTKRSLELTWEHLIASLVAFTSLPTSCLYMINLRHGAPSQRYVLFLTSTRVNITQIE